MICAARLCSAILCYECMFVRMLQVRRLLSNLKSVQLEISLDSTVFALKSRVFAFLGAKALDFGAKAFGNPLEFGLYTSEVMQGRDEDEINETTKVYIVIMCLLFKSADGRQGSSPSHPYILKAASNPLF